MPTDLQLVTQSEARKLARDKNEDGDYPNGMANIAHAVPVGSWGGAEQGWTVSLVDAPGNYGGWPTTALADMSVTDIQTELNWLSSRVNPQPGLPGTPRQNRLEERQAQLNDELNRRQS